MQSQVSKKEEPKEAEGEEKKDDEKKAGDEPEIEPEFLIVSNPCRVLKA